MFEGPLAHLIAVGVKSLFVGIYSDHAEKIRFPDEVLRVQNRNLQKETAKRGHNAESLPYLFERAGALSRKRRVLEARAKSIMVIDN